MKNWLSVTPPHSPFFHLIPHACFDNLDWIFFFWRGLAGWEKNPKIN